MKNTIDHNELTVSQLKVAVRTLASELIIHNLMVKKRKQKRATNVHKNYCNP